MKPFVVVIAAAASLAVGVVIGWRVGDEPSSGSEERLQLIEARRDDADAAARSLVDALDGLCANFDFFFTRDMANGAVRPVRCSREGKTRTLLIAYGFDSSETRQAWSNEYRRVGPQRDATLFEENVWAMEVLNPDAIDEVRSVELPSP